MASFYAIFSTLDILTLKTKLHVVIMKSELCVLIGICDFVLISAIYHIFADLLHVAHRV